MPDYREIQYFQNRGKNGSIVDITCHMFYAVYEITQYAYGVAKSAV